MDYIQLTTIGGGSEMVTIHREGRCFEYGDEHYRDPPTLEIELKQVRVEAGTPRPSLMYARAIVSLGVPKVIGCGLSVLDTIRFNLVFDAKRDGEMAWEEVVRFSVGQALDKWFPGSSELVEAQAAMP